MGLLDFPVEHNKEVSLDVEGSVGRVLGKVRDALYLPSHLFRNPYWAVSSLKVKWKETQNCKSLD